MFYTKILLFLISIPFWLELPLYWLTDYNFGLPIEEEEPEPEVVQELESKKVDPLPKQEKKPSVLHDKKDTSFGKVVPLRPTRSKDFTGSSPREGVLEW